MKKYACIFFLLFLSFSCKKEKNNTEVRFRIYNSTELNFSEVQASGLSFYSVLAGTKTSYRTTKDVLAYPGATVSFDKTVVYAGLGYCGTPPLPILPKGSYSLKIFRDTATYSGFNAIFIKD